LLLIGFSISSILLFFQTSKSQEYFNEAQIIHQDMTQNATYKDSKKYSLGVSDYSPVGMITVFPLAVASCFYRPFIWEALSPSFILNGIESVFLIFLTLRFLLTKKLFKRIKRIRQHEFLIYAFVFTLILGYFVGFTSILFGILVRFKAPILPFLIIVLTAHYKEEKENELKASNEKKKPWELV